jgi:secreted trypsin-like serine protease
MRRRHLAALVATLLLVSMVAVAAPASAISGGSISGETEFPFMALLFADAGGGSYYPACAGVLVGPTKIVTAAHCAAANPELAVLGETNLDDMLAESPESEFLEIVGIQVHPGYDTNEYERDVAVLTLSSASQADPVIVAKPSQSGLWSDAKSTRVAGWGYTSSSDSELSKDLRDALLPILSDDECQTTGTTVGCAGGRGPGICSGDSGGPALVNNAAGDPVLVGVLAYAAGDCASTEPGYFMRLGQDPINSWLKIQLDVTSPRVKTATPTGTGVDRDGNVKAVFTEKMRTATLSDSTFKLFREGNDGSWVRVNDVAVRPSTDGKNAVLNPFGRSAGRLAPRTKYKAIVTTDALDLARNALDQNRTRNGNQPKVWFFKTGG